MKVYFIMLTVGTLLVVAANLYKYLYLDPRARAEQEANLQRQQQQLVAEMIQVTALRNRYQELIQDLRKSTQLTQPTGSQADEINLPPDLEERISEVIRQLPSDFQQVYDSKNKALLEEKRAQEEANQLNAKLMPKIRRIYQVIRAVLLQASKDKLLNIKEISEIDLPVSLVFTTFSIVEERVERGQLKRGLQVRFLGDIVWHVYPDVGDVASPRELVPDWRARLLHMDGKRLHSPIIRIEEEYAGHDKVHLAAIIFDLETEEFQIHSDNPEVVALSPETVGDDLVGQAIILLLKGTRIRQETTYSK